MCVFEQELSVFEHDMESTVENNGIMTTFRFGTFIDESKIDVHCQLITYNFYNHAKRPSSVYHPEC